MSEYVRFIQRIGLVGLTNILISLSSLIFIPIITKSFTTAEYGMWAQVNTTIALVPNIANLGLPYTMVRFLSAEKDKEKGRNGVGCVAIRSGRFSGGVQDDILAL